MADLTASIQNLRNQLRGVAGKIRREGREGGREGENWMVCAVTVG